MIFVSLSKHHDRNSFDCGAEAINTYLKQSAGQQDRKNLARTVVMVESESSTQVLGFFTLVMGTACCDLFPVSMHLPRSKAAPVILLAQFGVDRSLQGQGYGTRLLYRALYWSMKASEYAGCLGVVLDAIDEKAAEFYKHRGFEELNDDPSHLWIGMKTIRDMFPTPT